MFNTIMRQMYYGGERGARRGCANKFFPINKRWGFKYSTDGYTSQKCFYTQQKAASFGLAPQIGQAFKFIHPHHDYIYHGYITERIDYVRSDMPQDDRYSPKTNKDYDNLLQSLMEHLGLIPDVGCFAPYDLHTSNVGYLNGKMVAIDFDHVYQYIKTKDPNWEIEPWEDLT